MHPLSTALFVLGYGLAIPIAGRLPTIVAGQQRLAMWGHQAGILLAAIGWLLRGQVLIAFAHLIWLVIAYVWFEVKSPRRKRTRQSIRRGGSTG
ncbi:MAG: hypothetical protein ACR2QK_09955 [Acidimicrobiales bacterium]